ncbi:MAG: hypothetical protein GX444_07975 [Myxococcales bacterium]|nr:hypothetical protein [Myxococcales bacterium]
MDDEKYLSWQKSRAPKPEFQPWMKRGLGPVGENQIPSLAPGVPTFESSRPIKDVPGYEDWTVINGTVVYYYVPISITLSTIPLDPPPYYGLEPFDGWVQYRKPKPTENLRDILIFNRQSPQNKSKNKSESKSSSAANQPIAIDQSVREIYSLRKRQFLVCLHGNEWDRQESAKGKIGSFKQMADLHQLIILAPAFDRFYFPQDSNFHYPPNLHLTPPLTMAEFNQLHHHYEENPEEKPANYREPNQFLYFFHHLLNDENNYRSDLRLLEILDEFKKAISNVVQDRFNILGYSAGGQFISRFMMVYPQLLNKIALGAPRSYMFPLSQEPFPYGLDCTTVADDLKRIDWTSNLNNLLDRQIFLFAGVGDVGSPPGKDNQSLTEAEWQGANHWERAQNFYFEMTRVDYRLKLYRLRDRYKEFTLTLVPCPGDHALAWTTMKDWLNTCWYLYPSQIAYLDTDNWVFR